MGNTVVLEKKDGVAIVKINRPEALNALNSDVIADLSLAIDQVETDPEIQLAIITGEGRSFVAGADIVAMKDLDMEQARKFGEVAQRVFRRIEDLDKPTIAVVNGFALGGGCELAMSCDMRIASDKAKFGQPEVGLGITPGFSGTQRLPRLVGKAKALELILTADVIKADEAERIGLVNKVAAADALMDEAMALAAKIMKNAPLAVRYSNLAVKRGLEVGMDAGIKVESDLFGMCFATADQKEGMSAFVEKRPADFQGK